MKRTISALTIEPYSDYHAQRKTHVTAHDLIDFSQCPAKYRLKKDGLLPTKNSSGFALGAAAHTLILEGDEIYARQYVVDDGPINAKTGQPFGEGTKAREEWIASVGGRDHTVLSSRDDMTVHRMRDSIARHDVASAMIDLDHGIAEGVLRATIAEIQCQARLDFYSLRHGVIELKTCRDLDDFEADAKQYGYKIQADFYATMAREAGLVDHVHLVAVEKQEPYRVGVWLACGAGEGDIGWRLRELRECIERDDWPSGYEKIRKMED